ncbi:17592_t:CDS:2 [Funneliformis geosporum]|uniref:17592_t:CDS:1 n=1 Tax=Funneliformis geosporum TaxID=1117311 RepID=A0A9W4SDS5_9GLOM|nr:17592_t:CDS:2 [Funneliformis geosporum]
MYAGILDLNELAGSDILELIIASDELLLDELLREKDVTNLSNWSEKDFMALKDTLYQFFEHIRFYEIFTNEFHRYIWPFRKVLPEALLEDIVAFYMSHIKPSQEIVPRHGKIVVDSNIIKPRHAAILVNWIQRNDPFAKIPKDHKYNFKLIYRQSRDGYDINTIRSKCNGHGACILIIRIKEGDTIFGGYNPLGWSFSDNIFYHNHYNDLWVSTTESFIFSFGNGKDSKNFIISRVQNSNNAMYESHYNPLLNFGNSDLVINGNTGTCTKAQYESKILDASNFNIEEMEIFNFY